MRLRIMFLALCMMPVGIAAPLPAWAATSDCPSAPAKLVSPPNIEPSDDARISSTEIDLEVDVGSDGRVRGLQLDRSSGDTAVDLEYRQKLAAAAYQPAQSGCVASSHDVVLRYQLTPTPGVSPAPLPKLDSRCAPYVASFLAPGPRDRKRTGTAIVAVELDAAATQTAPPVLKQGTGSPQLDKEALRIARDGQYKFNEFSSCTPAPFTYLLELTFE